MSSCDSKLTLADAVAAKIVGSPSPLEPSYLEDVYRKRSDLERKRKLMASVQGVLAALIILSALGISLRFNVFTLQFDISTLTVETVNFFVVVIVALTPVVAKFAIMEFVLQRVYHRLLEQVDCRRDLKGLTHSVSGHGLLNSLPKLRGSIRGTIGRVLYGTIAFVFIPLLRGLDYVIEFAPCFIAIAALISVDFGYRLIEIPSVIRYPSIALIVLCIIVTLGVRFLKVRLSQQAPAASAYNI